MRFFAATARFFALPASTWATIALVALLDVAGMVVGTFLYLVGLFRFVDRQPWRLGLAVALGVAALDYLVFVHWLHLPMPVGVLGF